MIHFIVYGQLNFTGPIVYDKLISFTKYFTNPI